MTDVNDTPRPLRHLPDAHGLYDPANEKDSCGIGFIAQLKGVGSHAIVTDALEMLHRMDHRGACGCEKNTGDGAGILTALPHALLKKVAARDADLTLPGPGDYAVGNLFLPTDDAQRAFCVSAFERELERESIALIGWRDMPTDADGADVGPSARSSMPVIRQMFVTRPEALDVEAFERRLYLVRNRVINQTLSNEDIPEGAFYVCSLSARVMVYKGQLTSGQVPLFYPDLRDPDYVSHLAMVHSRFSTNTFPSWDRSQPCRMMSHNGEINTVKGNKNWFAAREGLMATPRYTGEEIQDLRPVVNREASDSGSFDNVLEMLYMSGRSLPEAVMMMIPEAWENHGTMSDAKRDFYAYHANLMEPWDGPACIGFTDGTVIGATLDRNGLRPSRYYVTDDDRVIMASEVGVVDVDPVKVVKKGRLQPGRMFLVNFDEPYRRRRRAQRTLRRRASLRRLAAQERAAAGRLRGRQRQRCSCDRRRAAPRAAQSLWLHQRAPAHAAAADGQRRQQEQRGAGQHGQRPGARRAQRQPAAALRLLQAAVCAGHQPAHRPAARNRHHVVGDHHRP